MALEELRKLTERLSEERDLIYTLLDYIPSFAMVIDKGRIIRYANKKAREAGAIVGRHCWETFGKSEFISEEDKEYIKKHGCPPPYGPHCYFCLADEALSDMIPKRAAHIRAWGKVWDTYWIPISENLFLHYAYDVTEIEEGSEERTPIEEQIYGKKIDNNQK